MWLRRAALALAGLAVLLLLACGPGTRFGVWHYSTGFLLMRVAVYLGGAAALLCVTVLAIPRLRQGRGALLLAGLALALAAAALPLELQRRARAVPPINDISTAGDTAPAMAEQQRRAYPEIRPLLLKTSAEDAFAKARAAVERMGWEIVAADPAAGRIEAVATTFWFGFKDDVRLQVTPQGEASRIDVRSKSRVGRGDAGTNARRIREFLKRVE